MHHLYNKIAVLKFNQSSSGNTTTQIARAVNDALRNYAEINQQHLLVEKKILR